MALPSTVYLESWYPLPNESIAVIRFNRPKVKNAMSEAVYTEIDLLLEYFDKKESVQAVIFTGAGDFFTSGMDLMSMPTELPSRGASHRLMNRIIDHSKILVAAVNGHAIGIGVTMLTHCDLVFSVDIATFWTPFMRVGIVPEFGSSYLFPAILGPMLANDMLLRGKRINAKTALQARLISQLLPVGGFLDAVVNEVKSVVEQPCGDSLIAFKKIIKQSNNIEKSKVLEAIEREFVEIDKRFESGHFQTYQETMVKIGVLALQGAFEEHIDMLKQVGADAIEIRLPSQLEGLDALVFPGGESTAIAKVAERWGMIEPLKKWVQEKKPIWGTCAGMILLAQSARHGKEGGQALIGGLDVEVSRNFFGAQIRSFEQQIRGPPGYDENKPYNAVFIRAPAIVSVGEKIQVLSEIHNAAPANGSDPKDVIVAARKDNI
ncbi:glutamine amidotransferase subunit pdxT, partial [Thraustotheca clavata]